MDSNTLYNLASILFSLAAITVSGSWILAMLLALRTSVRKARA